ncbi:hypothetical protein MMC16_006414 [Acarospora aff. strigata]|nr:hypothetical protein [Acarospora aff. strigata]
MTLHLIKAACFKSTAVWAVATGVLDRGAELVKFGSHVWVEDTLDGGLSDWLLEVDKQTILRWKQGYQTTTYLPWGDPLRSKRQKPTTTSGKLQATCHCQGVQFHITPPDENSSKASSPWSNLLTPYPSASSDNPDDVKWWLRDNGTKYLAGTCTCKSCRLSSGFDVQTWAFVPRFNLFRSNDLPLNFDIGTLRCYASSPGTFRDFCRVCGATVFWHSNKRPDLVDVSVGLLNAESGARAEEWLDWFTERVSFQEDALNKSLVEGLAKGLRVWGEQHNS